MKSTKKTFFLLLLFVSGSTGVIHAQKCQPYFPTTRGATLEYTVDDIKNGNKAVIRQMVTDITETENELKIKIRSERTDINDRVGQKAEYTSSGEMEMRCENGIFYADVRSLLDSKTSMYKGGDKKLSGFDLQYPAQMSAGQALPDAEISIGAETVGLPIPPITISAINRKVTDIENITTSVGTFSCYKITSEVEMYPVVSSYTRIVLWISVGVGTVQSETYDENGKLQSKMVLTKLRQ